MIWLLAHQLDRSFPSLREQRREIGASSPGQTYRDEVFGISSRVAVMNQGHIEALGTPADVRQILERFGPAIPEGEAIP